MRTLLLSLLSFTISCLAQSNATELKQALDNDFRDKTLMLRGFPLDETVKFDASYHPLGQIRSGSWTLAGFFIEKVNLKGDQIELLGKRVGYEYDGRSDKFVMRKSGKKLRLLIQVPVEGSPTDIANNIRSRLFYENQDEVSAAMPELWKEYFEYAKNKPKPPAPRAATKQPVFTVGGGVTPPKPIYTPDPLDPGLLAVAGVTVLAVRIDSTGQTQNIRLRRPSAWGMTRPQLPLFLNGGFNPPPRAVVQCRSRSTSKSAPARTARPFAPRLFYDSSDCPAGTTDAIFPKSCQAPKKTVEISAKHSFHEQHKVATPVSFTPSDLG